MKKIPLIFLLLILLFSNVNASEVLRMSTTTSTENSGLLGVLNPVFEKKYNIRVDVIAVGTGKALRLAENGDVDIVFVHAPKAELEFVKKGFAVSRKAVMHNDFVLVGPLSDPANIKKTSSIINALTKIAKNQINFVSRGDDSGTHKKERYLWQLSQIKPQGSWYFSVGQGMGAALKIADEKKAYTLTDRGTFIALSDTLDLTIVSEGDKALFNPYHIMAVNQAKYPHVREDLAQQYIAFITGTEGQQIIASYKMKGEQLFHPDAIP